MSYLFPMPDADLEKLIDQLPFAHGGAREVYYVPNDATVVVKKQRDPKMGTNHLEWFIWQAVKNTHLRQLFGECFTISYSRRYLMMERLDDLAESDRLSVPAVPEWLQDVKGLTAFGKNAAGVINVRDYGIVDLGPTLATARCVRKV